MASLKDGKQTEDMELFEVMHALATEYNDIYSLDLQTNQISIFRSSGQVPGIKKRLDLQEGYDSAMHEYIRFNVFHEDHEMMFQMASKDKILEELRKNRVYAVHYRVKREEQIHYYVMKCVKIGETDSFSKIVIGFANEDHVSDSLAFLRAMEFDDLTGLYTQKAFYLHAESILKQNPDKQYDMVLSDLENFKRVNERYGRSAGDQILKSIAGVLRKRYNEDTISGRYGNDQFVTIRPHEENYDFAGVTRNMESKLPVKNLVVKLSVYENVEHDLPVSELCDRMLIALRTIKGQYGKTSVRYDETIKRNEEHQNQIEENMRKALEEEQFQIYYQPKYDLRANQIAGAEALVRWIHPKFGFMNPGEFIPLFEKNGFIKKLDWYVWEKVCADLAGWKAEGKPVVPVSVNMSRRDFEQKNLAHNIIKIVNQYNLDHSLLHIEITESCYAHNSNAVVETTQLLHDAGFQIELDDFGTGYSSLTSLSNIPLDVLKLDISLIQKEGRQSEQNILEFAIQLAKVMDLKIVQEGVETEEQVNRVRAHGCDYVQGYYYSQPLSKEKFEAYFQNTCRIIT